MTRSDFLQKGYLATGVWITSSFFSNKTAAASSIHPSAEIPPAPFHLNYGPHDGMFQNLAGTNFLDQIQFMHDQGFRGIEDNGMTSRSPEEQQKIGELLAKLGMAMGVFVLNKGGNGANTLAAGKQEYINIFLKGCREAIEVSKRCGGKLTTVVPGNFFSKHSIEIQTTHVIDALRRGAELLEPHGIIMVLEPLSDTPDLFLRTSNQTYLICKAVNSPSCKILYDIYHMQRNEGDLIANMERTWDEIAYIQVGDNPGRKEPGTGEINYKNIFKFLYEKGYQGVVGMEHGIAGLGREGEERLLTAYREADSF